MKLWTFSSTLSAIALATTLGGCVGKTVNDIGNRVGAIVQCWSDENPWIAEWRNGDRYMYCWNFYINGLPIDKSDPHFGNKLLSVQESKHGGYMLRKDSKWRISVPDLDQIHKKRNNKTL